MKINTQNIKQEINNFISKGASRDYAISLVADRLNINPNKLMKLVYPTQDSDNDITYDDIKTKEGSYVILKNKPDRQYEVINIVNKGKIIIRDILDNTEYRVSEEEILPVVTENKMKQMNEAVYNLDITNLQTYDADKLAEILSTANEADIANNEETMPQGETLPPEAEIVATDEIAMEPEMEPEIENAEDWVDEYNDYTMDDLDEGKMTEDYLERPESREEKAQPDEPKNNNKNVDEFMADYFYDNAELQSEFDNEMLEKNKGQIYLKWKELLDNEMANEWEAAEKAANIILHNNSLNEAVEDDDDYSKMVDNLEDAQYMLQDKDPEKYNEVLTKYLKEVGKDISDMSWAGDFIDMVGMDKAKEAIEELYGVDVYEDIEDIKDEEMLDDEDSDEEILDDEESDEDSDEEILDDEESDEDYIDESINDVLRIAGVELDEVSDKEANKGKKDLPMVVGEKTAFSNAKQHGFKAGENQRAKYHQVKNREKMGKESSAGVAPTLTVGKDNCCESKIESIYETARSMYAKKDCKDWKALDRRYIEKLIREGVGFENASKLLLKAKKNH